MNREGESENTIRLYTQVSGTDINGDGVMELTAPYVKVGGAVLAMKGSAAREELAECTSAIKKLGLQLESVKEFSIDGASHAVIVLRKTAPTPKQYPRRYAKIKQSPL